MKKVAFITFFLLVLGTTSVYAVPTPSVLGGSVSINEVLYNPVGSPGFDTDGNGTPAATDEFVELYNGGVASVDISGWELWDRGSKKWFAFPAATILPANSYALVVMGVQTGGTLPTMTNPNSLAFNNGRGSGVINNTSDNVVLYDPGANEYIQIYYNGAAIDNPPVDYTGFSATASRVGTAENWGSGAAGKSLTRFPSGDSAVGVHDVIVPGGPSASPTAVTLTSFTSSTPSISALLTLAVLFGLAGSMLALRRKRAA